MRTYDHQPSGTIDRARQLRRDSTEVEKILWRALREKLPSAKWRRQMPIGPYFADFASFSGRLVVELDGGQHADASEYDRARTRLIEGQRYRVLRFWNNDVTERMDGVLETIATALSPSPSRGSAAQPSPAGRGMEAHRAGRVRVTP